MSNEAAERLREWLARRGFDNGMFADGMAFPLELDAALAAEHRATVQRIRAALNGPGFTRWATVAYADDPTLLNAPEWAVDEAALLAILDAEAER